MGLQGTVIRTIFQAAGSPGAAYDELCRLSGIDPAAINDSEKMVEWEKAALIWVPLLKLSGDPLIGLHTGAGVDKLLHGMVGFLIQSSKDIDQGLRMLHQYGRMTSPMVEYRYSVEEVAVLEIVQNKMWVMKHPEPARHANDFLIAATVNTIKSLSVKNIAPLRVELSYDMRSPDEYRRVLGAEVVFNRDTNRIVLAKEDVLCPAVTSDQSMFELFKGIVAERSAALESNSLSEKLRQLLFMQFKGRIPTIGEAAESLNVTARYLQRRLLEENTSFRDIAGDVRKDIALQLMKNPAIKISEVSDILGYSDLTAFRKAFKGWTAATPRELRKKQFD